ncbi:PilZ domain-containing protein [Variovorax ginsengisoli]|uniref:PilZ domain-containing protein n=1 Tax=Variovorax ginsengisoli TaxID=363844 RepID=A0ABT9SDZ0_9BURK|nr:PilZ domain-containing protein [Variovorax ginsengisoli]MDP9902574.1 hypothetical protein [Variovorax ginsengisoli]
MKTWIDLFAALIRRRSAAALTMPDMTASPPAGPIEQAEVIRDMMSKLAKLSSALRVRSPDGVSVAEAKLVGANQDSLYIVCDSMPFVAPGETINLSVPTDDGVMLFAVTLDGTYGSAQYWNARMPDKVVCQQSRDTRRIKIGSRDPVHLDGLNVAPHIIDISETGIGFTLPEPLPLGTYDGSELRLLVDTYCIELPAPEIMHCTLSAEGRWRCGMRWNGVSDTSLRWLRRWLNKTETRHHLFYES